MNGSLLANLLALALPDTGLLYWWTGARARERAIEHARHACRQREVQFLDQSVALSRRRAVRLPGGSLGLRREFVFEFTTQSAFRDDGRVLMQGPRLLRVEFPYTRDADGARVYEH